MLRRKMTVTLLLAGLAFGAAWTSPAAAQLSTAEAKAAAEALFDEGRKLRAAGKFLEAAEKFEQSQKLDPGIGTLLRLADCYEQAGRLASAWANFRQAASMANARADKRRAKIAEDRVAELEPRLSKLTLELGDNAWLDGVTITRNGTPVDVSMTGIPLPLDGGTYEIVVEAPGYQAWSKTVDLTEEGRDEVITVPDLEPEAGVVPPPAPTSDGAGEGLPDESEPEPEPVPAPAPPSEPDTSGPIHPANWVALGLAGGAVVATAVGVGLMVDALNLDKQADDYCDGTVCSDPRGADLSDKALVQANGATAAFVVAGVMAGGALVTFFATPWRRNDTSQLSFAPFVAPEPGGRMVGGAALGGRF